MEKALVEGMPVTELIAVVAKKFGVSERQGYKDLKEVHRRWHAAGLELKMHSERMLAQAVSRREHLYRLSLQAGDRPSALSAEQDRCKLLALYPTAESKVKLDGTVGLTGKDGGPIEQLVVYLPHNHRDKPAGPTHQATAEDLAAAAVAGSNPGPVAQIDLPDNGRDTPLEQR